jgi:hypothetical protein
MQLQQKRFIDSGVFSKVTTNWYLVKGKNCFLSIHQIKTHIGCSCRKPLGKRWLDRIKNIKI